MSEFMSDGDKHEKIKSDISNHNSSKVKIFLGKLTPIFFLFFASLVWLAFFRYAYLNYSGFCFKEMRYLSDDEKIRMAINHLNKPTYFYDHEDPSYWYSSGIKKGTPNRYQKKIPYESVDAFLDENPGCCTLIPKDANYNGVDYEERPPTFWERILGKYNYAVKVKYVMRYVEGPLDEKGKEGIGQRYEKTVQSVYNASNCGEFCHSCFDN